MARHWYVALVKPSRQERIERSIRLIDFKVFNPRVRYKHPKGDGTYRYRTGPYLPGYLFVQLDLVKDLWEDVLAISGVRGFIKNETALHGEPSEGRAMVRVRRGVIPAMMAEFGGQFAVDQRKLDEAVVRVGDRIRVKMGTYEDFQADVLGSSDTRISFMLELFGKNHLVQLPRESVELVGGSR